ncbi:MAG: branched-chain amino acid transport system II carrier protein, partial [Lachnospiraceae bacterium]|nr:branched-chain amino acid transport system II carrier protein [Lachnospiraceae bacterium]
MKKNLSLKESIIVGSMLFGMFFGAGNLIFPVHMGQLAGTNS